MSRARAPEDFESTAADVRLRSLPPKTAELFLRRRLRPRTNSTGTGVVRTTYSRHYP